MSTDRISPGAARHLALQAFAGGGMPADLAELAVQALVRANHEALESHALARAPLNVAQQRAGKVVIGARPRPPALPPTLPRAPMRSRFRQRFMLA